MSQSQLVMFNRKELPISSMNDIYSMGQLFAQSGIFGDIPPQVGFMVALTCYQEHLSPVDFQKIYDIIKGKITKKAKAMLAEFKCFGGRIQFHEYSDARVDITFIKGNEGIRVALTIEDAINQGVALTGKGNIKEMWQKFPRRMLFARVISEGVGVLCPGITTGIYTPEEVTDFTPEEVSLKIEDDYSPGGDEVILSKKDEEQSDKGITIKPQSSEDVEVCQLEGKFFNVRWESMDDETLKLALTAQISDATRAHIKKLLVIREANKAQ